MNDFIQTVSGFGYGVIIGTLAKIQAQESHRKKSTQEKAEAITLALFSGGSILCQLLLPDRFAPTLTGIAFGLTIGATKAVLKSKKPTFASIATIASVFLYHRNEITIPIFLTWATALTAVSYLEQQNLENIQLKPRIRSRSRGPFSRASQ